MSARAAWVAAACYGCLLLALSTRLPLWLDEVLTLAGAAQPDLGSLLVNLEQQQGATPLAFLIPHAIVRVWGVSLLSARAASVVASALSLPAVHRLARFAGLRWPAACLLLFAVWPLQLRYGLEARPYALALCLSAWASVAFLERWRPPIYAALVAAIALAHPYGLAMPLAHLLWSWRWRPDQRSVALHSLAAAVALLAPWYAYFSAGWRAISAEQNLAAFNWRGVLVWAHEIAGTGYAGTALLLAGALAGLRRLPLPGLWGAMAATPLIAVPLANALFAYFFAVRQTIYALPALAVLFTGGAERGRWRWIGAVLLAAMLYEDVRWFGKPHEDWQAAAAALRREAQAGACVWFLDESRRAYLFYQPELERRLCRPGAPRVALALSPYGSADRYPRLAAALEQQGLRKISTQSFAGPRIEVFAQ
jgi:hypothetical protein